MPATSCIGWFVLVTVLLWGGSVWATEYRFGTMRAISEVNSSSRGDWAPTISPDGLELYFASSRRPGGIGDIDIWTTRRDNIESEFSAPTNLGDAVNTVESDSNPELSSDGLTLYYDTERQDSNVDRDIWVLQRDTISSPWQSPLMLGGPANSSNWEGRPSVSQDGLTLVFDRNHDRRGTIWLATRASTADDFGTPVDLGIVGSGPEISADGLSLFFSANVVETPVPDCELFVSERPSTHDPFGTPVRLPAPLNSPLCEVDPELSADGRTLYFARADLTADPNLVTAFTTSADLWQVELLPGPPAGDFDGDGLLTALDMDLLSSAIRTGGELSGSDLNGDGTMTDDDRLYWVATLAGTYIGDANLDGQFDTTDLVTVISAGQYEDDLAENSGWASGDWNGDGDFTSSDLIAALADGGYEQGPRAAVSAVPEPNGLLLLLSGMAGMVKGESRRVKKSSGFFRKLCG